VVFINTPLRVDNPEWQRLGLPAVENVYRQELGAALELSELDKLAQTLNRLLAGDPEFKKRLPALRDVLVANWQKAAQIGGDYIISKARKN
jgi:YidC/Oxa1 family membrane protein insertase